MTGLRKCGHPLGTTRWCPDCEAAPSPVSRGVEDSALARMMPIFEKCLKDLVFTADKAGQVIADMNTLRAALAAKPAEAEPDIEAIIEERRASWNSAEREAHVCPNLGDSFEPTMSIHATPGTVVRFRAGGGYEWEGKRAIEAGFVKNNLYTVKRCDIGHSKTEVLFDEIPGRWNSALFADLARSSVMHAADRARRALFTVIGVLTDPAGFQSEVLKDKAQFRSFLAGSAKRVDDAVEEAKSAHDELLTAYEAALATPDSNKGADHSAEAGKMGAAQESEREMFEAYIQRECSPGEACFFQDKRGAYLYWESEWKAWQASAACSLHLVESPTQDSEPSEPEWIDDPHDIEQGRIRNPKWKAPVPAAPRVEPLQARATELHEKASMPWPDAEELALTEAGVTPAQIDELIGECASSGLETLIANADDLRQFTRSVLVHAPALSTPAQEAREPEFTTPNAELNDLLNETYWMAQGPNNHDTVMAWAGALDKVLVALAASAPEAEGGKPLTDEEIEGIFYPMGTATEAQLLIARAIARAIEAAHGIKAAGGSHGS